MTAGYVCAPYLHNHNSVELKDSWSHSRNIEDMFFVTATFSSDSKPYFPSSANHYILAKFKDRTKIEKEGEGKTNLISVYYLDYSDSEEDIVEIANVVAKRDKVAKAGIGRMDLYCNEKPKFTFPYNDHIVVLEVSSEKGHQSDNKYCERTRRDVGRKGITMTNLVSLSVLEKLK